MTDTTKPDLTREAVERLADDLYAEFMRRPAYEDDGCSISYAADILRALLDAKEAAERERDHEFEVRDRCRRERDAYAAQLTEARASAAAAWEAGRDHVIYVVCRAGVNASGFTCLTNPDPSATESLRRVKEAVWEEGFLCALKFANGADAFNPYATEAKHD